MGLRFTLRDKPPGLAFYRKRGRVQLLFVTEPFEVETQEGVMRIAPDTVEDWDGGYYVAFPDDGSKPYAIAPAYVRANYERNEPAGRDGRDAPCQGAG